MSLPALLCPDRLRRCKTCACVEPSGQRRVVGKNGRLPGQISEHDLGDILGPMGVTAQLAQAGGVDEIKMASHEFSERLFRATLSIPSEQFGIIVHNVSSNNTRPLKIRTKKMSRFRPWQGRP